MNWKDGQPLLSFIALFFFLSIMKVPPSLYPNTSPTLNCAIHPEAHLGAIPASLTEHGISSVHSIFYPSSRPSQQLFLGYHLPWEAAFGLLSPFFPLLNRPIPSCPAGPSNMPTLDSAVVI